MTRKRTRADARFPTGDEGPRTGVRLDEDAYIALVRTVQALSQPFVELFKTHRLSGAQYNVLRIVRRAGADGILTRRIGEQLLTPVPDVTRLVDRLEMAKLVSRRRCTEDRRVIWIKITSAGRKLLSRVEVETLAVHERQFAHMSKTKLKQLVGLLNEARTPH